MKIYQEKENFKEYKSQTEVTVSSLKDELLEKQKSISLLQEKYSAGKITHAVDHHKLQDGKDELNKELVGERLMRGANHAHDEGIIKDQGEQITSLEESIEKYKERISAMESQLPVPQQCWKRWGSFP